MGGWREDVFFLPNSVSSFSNHFMCVCLVCVLFILFRDLFLKHALVVCPSFRPSGGRVGDKTLSRSSLFDIFSLCIPHFPFIESLRVSREHEVVPQGWKGYITHHYYFIITMATTQRLSISKMWLLSMNASVCVCQSHTRRWRPTCLPDDLLRDMLSSSSAKNNDSAIKQVTTEHDFVSREAEVMRE